MKDRRDLFSPVEQKVDALIAQHTWAGIKRPMELPLANAFAQVRVGRPPTHIHASATTESFSGSAPPLLSVPRSDLGTGDGLGSLKGGAPGYRDAEDDPDRQWEEPESQSEPPEQERYQDEIDDCEVDDAGVRRCAPYIRRTSLSSRLFHMIQTTTKM